MSLELLLLLAVFVLLPLLQQLVRAVRQTDQGTPERAGAQPDDEDQSAIEELQLPADAPLPLAPAGPRLPATARHKLSEPLTELERTPTREAAGPLALAPTAHGSGRRHTVVAGLRNPRGLRRAIVLMTILGPCRASQR